MYPRSSELVRSELFQASVNSGASASPYRSPESRLLDLLGEALRGLKNPCENSWIPDFAGMTALAGKPSTQRPAGG